MPAFDRLANTLIGDNPALTEALRHAQDSTLTLSKFIRLNEDHSVVIPCQHSAGQHW